MGRNKSVNEKVKKGEIKKSKMKHKWRERKSETKKRQKIESKKEIKNPNVKGMKKLDANNKTSAESLRDRMVKRLEAAKFRQFNEELDKNEPQENPQDVFSNIKNFKKYHQAYSERVKLWEKNPLDIFIGQIKTNYSSDKIIADFGCGEGKLAAAISNKVFSFDLFALNDRVTACDMSNLPIEDETIDVGIFCLSLMGTEIGKYIAEANRVIKKRGVLKIAEVSSRFDDTQNFIKKMKRFGFLSSEEKKKAKRTKIQKNDGQVFVLFDFVKVRGVTKKPNGKIPILKLNPCLYKKR